MSPPPRRPSFEDLYARHWQHVLHLMPDYGIPAIDHGDLAQTVWMTVHLRLESYDPERHKTPRAWLTGIVRRCAANHRRARRRRPEVLVEDAGAHVTASGLDPEQAALLQTLRQAIADDDRREALVLQVRHGLSLAEIAAVQGVSEDSVEWRLRMAKEDLKAEDGEKKARGFLGFGSLEALAEALRPEPIPDEVGAALRRRIEERIREQRGPDEDGEDRDDAEGDSDSGSPPATSRPPAALTAPAAPPLAPTGALAPTAALAPTGALAPTAVLASTAGLAPAALLLLTPGKLAGLVTAAFLVGAATGAPAVLAWEPHDAAPAVLAWEPHDAAPAVLAWEPHDAAPAVLAWEPHDAAPDERAPDERAARGAGTPPREAPVAQPSLAPSPRAPPPPGTAAARTQASSPAAPRPDTAPRPARARAPAGSTRAGSDRLLGQMRRAAEAGQHAHVVALADDRTPALAGADAALRERLRVEALVQLGRTAEAEQRARAMIAGHPEHRRAMERALGRALP